MKKILFLAILLFSFISSLKAQTKSKTFIGLSPTMESNTGFGGLMLNLEQQEKISKRLFFSAGLNGFYSDKVLDRAVGDNIYNKSVIGDLGLVFKINKSEKSDFTIYSGLTARYSKIRVLTSYQVNLQDNTPYNLNYTKIRDKNWGYKIGLAYGYNVSTKNSITLFVDTRFIDIKSEPTFLNSGIKLGFLR